ncbi:MAG: DUF3105 domain-containing protein [Anaerolineae bacterium]|nr:DUF3105 domain-containing protein [Anaerolineae bacterium]
MRKKTAIRRQPTQPKTRGRIGGFLTMDRLVIGGSVLLSFIIVGIIALNSYVNRRIDIEGVEQIVYAGGLHLESVNYEQSPPMGGPHAPRWQNCGVYLQPIRDEAAIHSLEHGAIWITYRPDLPDTDLERLRDITWQSDSRLLSPYPNLPSPIVVSAWGYQLQLDSADDERLAQFVRQYERAASAPEPRGFCSNGEGQPFTQFSG